MKALFVYVTCGTPEEAGRIAEKAVKARHAACANIFPPHASVYWWEDRIENAEETALILKTTGDKFEALESLIKEVHSYDCPCIVALPVEKAHEPFLNWIKTETGQ